MKGVLPIVCAGCLLVSLQAGAQAPIILSQPQSVTVNNASAASFAVEATNAAGYQWQFNGSILAGATNAMLSLDDVSSNEAGLYSVAITSTDGSKTNSQAAQLAVVPGTIIQITISTYPDGGGSNFLVQLFDHDKPATVENFIHYITSGSYSNMFFDRDVTNFVLQGGDYVTYDRTTNALNGGDIFTGTNIFPSQVDSEFNVGPLIHNTFGTLAMALVSGNPDSATSAFFFNLADNSTNLDYQNGGFTVFGRILSGTNILQYFNTLSAPSNGIFDLNFNIPTLPVNDNGTNEPSDANLFYCDFSFQTPPPLDPARPTVAISSPAPNASFTNGSPLTVQGTAEDNVGVAEVYCVLTSLTGAYGGLGQTNAASGTTNWSLNLVSLLGTIPPGIYQLSAIAQDGAGNLSAPATEYFTNLARLTIVTNVDGRLTNGVPQYLLPGQLYSVTASPGPGQQFYSWTSNGVVSLNPVQTFQGNANLTVTVTYLSTNASAGLTITNPAPGAQAFSVQSVLTVGGAIASTNVTSVMCQFFVNSNAIATARAANIVGANWSLTATNLANGSNYILVALATNATGGSELASTKFTLLNVDLLTLNIVGGGTILSNPDPYVVPGTYTVKAAPDAGQAFYSWSDGVTTTLSPIKTFRVVSNLTLTATFVPENNALRGINFTYPRANAMLTNGTFTVAGKLPVSLGFTQMTCQLFLQSNGVTALPQAAAIDPGGATWSFPVTNLVPGPYEIWAVGYDNNGVARLVSESFNLLAKFAVGVEPPGSGSVTGNLNGKYLQVGNSYKITAKASQRQIFAYWTGAVANTNSAETTFIMSSNTSLTANFTSNLFAGVAGTYTGLFLNPSYVSPTNAGFVTLTTTATGSFSGQLKFPSRTYAIGYAFPYSGTVLLPSRGLDSNVLQLALSLDLTNGSDTITGFVADVTPSGFYVWASSMVLHRSVTRLAADSAPAAGKYVVLLQPDNETEALAASGYAAISLQSSGAVAMGGALPDNTAFSQSARISQDGVWPVYIVPSSYKKHGLIIGWQTNTPTGMCDGQLFWFNPATGYATNLISSGAAFAAPAAGTQYQMVLAGGASNSLGVSKTSQFVRQAPIVNISLLSSGVLSGKIEINNNARQFRGAFVRPSIGGAGFIVDTNGQTDGFQILPQP